MSTLPLTYDQWVRRATSDVVPPNSDGLLHVGERAALIEQLSYLKKRNERGVWQQRWFVLQGLELKYYNSQKDATGGKDPKGVIPVMTVQSAEYAGAIGGENHCFEIKVSSRTEKDRTYQLSAISSAIAKSWCSSIDTTRDAFRATGQRSGHTVTSAPASRHSGHEPLLPRVGEALRWGGSGGAAQVGRSSAAR